MVRCRVPRSAHSVGHVCHKGAFVVDRETLGAQEVSWQKLDLISNRTQLSSKLCQAGLMLQNILMTMFSRINPFLCKFPINFSKWQCHHVI